MSHVFLPLSCFGTPRLGRAASRYTRGFGSPRWSAARGRLSNWQPAGADGALHLDWKSSDDGHLYVWWKYSRSRVQSLSSEQAFLIYAWSWALLAVGLPHPGLLAAWFGLGPAKLLGWLQLPNSGLRFGPVVQQGLPLHWVGPPAQGLLWQLPSLRPPAQGLGNGPRPST
ncbi:hypothetical protein FF1_013475 [Malus domestica]